jgi:hypothetical protein
MYRFLLNSSDGKPRFSKRSIISTTSLLLVTIGLFVFARYSRIHRYQWDLRSSSNIDAISWPTNVSGEYWLIPRSNLKMTLKDNDIFEFENCRIDVRRNADNSIYEIMICSLPLSFKEVKSQIADIYRKYPLFSNYFKNWESRYENASFASYIEVVLSRTGNPAYEIEIGPSFEPDRPFISYFIVHWGRPPNVEPVSALPEATMRKGDPFP